MRDDSTRPLRSDDSNPDDLDNQIDELLPVPSRDDETEHEQVDGPVDTLLPAPGEESHSADDATTREDLEVDTTADGIDDIIDPSPNDGAQEDEVDTGGNDIGDAGPETIDGVAVGAEVDDEDYAHSDGTEIAGEPDTRGTVEEPAPNVDDDHEPVNHDSAFFAASYRPDEEPHQQATYRASSGGTIITGAAPEQEIARQCPACGAAIGEVPYCPQCGTDQYPNSRLAKLLSPLLSWSRPPAIRLVLMIATVLALLALLADSGANALVIAAITMPVVLVMRITMHLQGHTRTGWMQIGVMAVIGLISGLPLAWLAARLVKRSWFDTGVLNFGAAGFGGNFAETAGVAPFFVWLVVGFLLPIVVILGIGAAPTVLRMVLDSPPGESTGMILSGAVAAGFVIATAIMFYRPLYTEMAPRMTTSQWTLTVFGLGVIRPLVWIFGGAMIGAVVWRFLRTASPASVTVPAAIAAAIPLGFSVFSLAAEPAGHWAETVVGLLFAAAAVFFYHRFLPTAIRNDATLLAGKTPTN